MKKPTYHLYAFMARMGSEILARGDDHLVCRAEDGTITALVWAPVGDSTTEQASERHEIRLSVPVRGPSQTVFALRSTVNETEGNAWSAWREMGRPRFPSEASLSKLREAAEPVRRHESLTVQASRVDLDLTLGRHEVSLIELTPVHDETPAWLDDTRIVMHRTTHAPSPTEVP